MKKVEIAITNSASVDDNYAIYLYDNNNYMQKFTNNGMVFRIIESRLDLVKPYNLLLGICCNGTQIGTIAVSNSKEAKVNYPFLFVIKVLDKKTGIDYQLIPYVIFIQDKIMAINEYIEVTYGEELTIQLPQVKTYSLVDIDMIYPSAMRNNDLPSPQDERKTETFWQIKEVQKRLKDESKQQDKRQ
ncbi:hypothetical protein GAMM_260007 [Gammaproteobacteria bacterium]